MRCLPLTIELLASTFTRMLATACRQWETAVCAKDGRICACCGRPGTKDGGIKIFCVFEVNSREICIREVSMTYIRTYKESAAKFRVVESRPSQVSSAKIYYMRVSLK